MVSKDDVLKALSRVEDPELHKDIVPLHMVEDVLVSGDKVSLTLNLTTPACPLRTKMEQDARDAVRSVKGVAQVDMKVGANISATRQFSGTDVLKGVKNVIAVASGKGGVGKSTVAVNLAVVLAQSGAKVGILDADIYGPNIPLMMGVHNPPQIRGEIIVPPVEHGVKVVSLGFFYKDDSPLIWRGPMVAGAVRQLLTQVDWGELDYLIVDLPPGCLPAGSLVLTANNVPKPIENLKPGDFVLSYDGRILVPRRVLGVLPQGKQRVFKLKTPNRSIVASGNHPFLKYHRKIQWRRLDQLKAGDRILVSNCVEGGQAFSLPKIDHDPSIINLPSVTTPDFMRIVGHFVGDGFVKVQKGRKAPPVGLRVCEPKVSKLRDTYENLYKAVFNCRTFEDNDGQKFGMASVPLAKLFAALDLNHKAGQKQVPDWVFTLPLEQRSAFIRGYAEADGTIRHRESVKNLPDWRGSYRSVLIRQDSVSVESTNSKLVSQIHELCIMTGLRSTNVREEVTEEQALPGGRVLKQSTAYQFQFSLKVDRRPFKIARITEIVPAGEMETFDLQVEQYENFVANSILVHNTGDAGLTLAQTVPLGGVVIVTTPQEAALNIATKALAMFRKLNVPILGIVENMSYFVCQHCQEKSFIFSTGGGRKAAALMDVQFLGEIPIYQAIREQSDRGIPVTVAAPASKEAIAFKEIAFRVAGMLSIVAYSQVANDGRGESPRTS